MRGANASVTRRRICATLCMMTTLSACATIPTPDPPPVDIPPLEWQACLLECVPVDDGYQCPAPALERAWDSLSDYHVDLIACRRDLRDVVQVHKVRIAAAEAAGDDWWIWLLAGVAAGAAAVGGVWVGTSF